MQAPTTIAVAGATGRVGRHVVEVLKAGGHDVVAMPRSSGVDVVTGDGLPEVLAGVHRDRPGHRSWRSPERKRRALSIWPHGSRPGAVTRCGSRARVMLPTRTAAATTHADGSRGPHSCSSGTLASTAPARSSRAAQPSS